MTRDVVVPFALGDPVLELSSTRYVTTGEDKFAEDKISVCRDENSADVRISHLAVLTLLYRHLLWYWIIALDGPLF